MIPLGLHYFTKTEKRCELTCEKTSPESVKAVDVDPHPQVGEEESEHLPVGVVEEARVPELVVAAAVRVEETGVGAVELVDKFCVEFRISEIFI